MTEHPVVSPQVDAARSGRPVLLLASLILCMGLAALDNTIVATALPTIVSDLGGFTSFSWVFSIYLLTQTAVIPVYGRLADMVGRRPMLYLSVLLFLAGSALCGQAHSMTELIVFRGIQGIGAGGLMPLVQTVVGDLFGLQQRAKVQGLLSSVWAISAVVGPILGGLLVLFSWRLIFYVNLPVGLLALAGLAATYREKVRPRRSTLDVLGSGLFLAGVTLLILGLLQGGEWGWFSSWTVGCLAASVALLLAFLGHESRIEAPMFPVGLLKVPIIGWGNLSAFLGGGLLIGLSGYIPTFVQGVDGQSPTVAGAILALMSIGWPLASSLASRFLLLWGCRRVAVLGGALTVLGTGALLLLRPGTPAWHVAPMTFLVGGGLGFLTTTVLVLIQEEVGYAQRGAATGSNLFARMLGSSLFAGMMGAVLNSGLGRIPDGVGAVNALLGVTRRSLSPEVRHLARLGLADGLHQVFLFSFALAALSLATAFLLPDIGQAARPQG